MILWNLPLRRFLVKMVPLSLCPVNTRNSVIDSCEPWHWIKSTKKLKVEAHVGPTKHFNAFNQIADSPLSKLHCHFQRDCLALQILSKPPTSGVLCVW